MSNNWEKAAQITTQNQSHSDDPERDAMHAKQRQIAFDDWQTSLNNVKNDPEVQQQDPITPESGWVHNYQSSPVQEDDDEITALLKESGRYYPAYGLLRSVSLLIEELEATKTQLDAIKRLMK